MKKKRAVNSIEEVVEHVKPSFQRTFDVIEICDQIYLGKADQKDLAFVGQIIKDFTKSDAFKIIKRFNENQLKGFLTGGRAAQEQAEFRLGQLEGMQMGFENQVVNIIGLGDSANKAIMNEDEVYAGDDN